MDKILLFYEKDDYYDFKDLKSIEGYSISSITKLIHNLSLIENINIDNEIIDISALTEYNNMQSIIEQIMYQFNEVPIFICDSSKRERLEYELRFIFDKFENVDKSLFLQKNKKVKSDEETNQLAKKKHKKIIDLTDDELNHFLKSLEITYMVTISSKMI